MKAYLLSLLGLAVVVGGGIWFVASRPVGPGAVPTPPELVRSGGDQREISRPIQAPPPRVESEALVRVEPEGAAAAAGAAATPPILRGAEEAGRRVHLLTSTFDPQYIPELVAYLRHPLAEVRRQAMMGLIMLGEPEAAPHLVDAAKTASAEEAQALLQAADQLSKIGPDEPRMPRVPLEMLERTPPSEGRRENIGPGAPVAR
jgi:hypothetical protein